MTSKSALECGNLWMARFEKLLSGEIIPGRKDCHQPYDSEWERQFEWVLAKHIPDFIVLRNQVPFGRFRVDFVFECIRTGTMWIVEFDGKTYHDAERDRQRDEIILRDFPMVEAIVRVDAKTGHLEDYETRAVLAKILPKCFDIRYGPMLRWKNHGGVYTTKIFDDRFDEDVWRCEGELDPNAPMVELRIEVKRRAA